MNRYKPIGPRRRHPGPPRPFRALTIQPPYGSLIVGWDDPGWLKVKPKRIENRRWTRCIEWAQYRGHFLIHQGRSREWLHRWAGPTPPAGEMPFGALIGSARLVAHVTPIELATGDLNPQLRWIADDPHYDDHEESIALVLDDVRRFREPIPMAGKQGWWNVPRTPEIVRALETAYRLPTWLKKPNAT